MEAVAVSIKPIAFSQDRPDIFFAVLEAQFTIANITVNSTKFFHCLPALPTVTLSYIDPAVLASQDYERLKRDVLRYFCKPQRQIYQQFFSNTPLLGQPSMYLKDLRTMATRIGRGLDDQVIRYRFEQALPPSISQLLIPHENLSFEELGVLADTLMASNPPASQEIKAIERQPSEDRTNSRQKPTENQGCAPYFPGQRPKICRNHIYFAHEATACQKWCRFHKRKSTRMRSPSPRKHLNMTHQTATIDCISTFTVAFVLNNKVVNFLIDTGASVSLIPPSYVNKSSIIKPTNITLCTVSGEPLSTSGEVSLTLTNNSLKQSYVWWYWLQ